MHILHIIPRFIGGGPERHLLALVSAWREAKVGTTHTFVVLTGPASALLLVRARRLGVNLHIAPDLDVIRDAISAADVVELTFWNHPALYALLREPLPAARWVLRSAVAGTSSPQVLIDALGERSDAIVTSSVVSLDTPACTVARHRGCRTEFLPSLADMRRLDGFQARPHSGIRVGYLGLVEPTKMHPAFAHLVAAVTVPDVYFDVYGDGSWSEQLRAQCGALGMSDRVQFHGHVEDIRTAFATMDIFGYPLAPDTSATSEKVMQEAMWVGIPTVVLAGSAAASLVQHERTGLVCQGTDEYPHAIDRLATDSALRAHLAAGARRFARDEFDPHHNAARFVDVFHEVRTRPKRAWVPVPGRDATGAECFVQSIGHLGEAFARSLAEFTALNRDELLAADVAIGGASAVLAHGEGGVVQYRNAYPRDPHLRLWSGHIALAAGRRELARQEFNEALALGMHPSRIPLGDTVYANEPEVRS
jgi:glycosyltransferase involved in cell wall biosynthesis